MPTKARRKMILGCIVSMSFEDLKVLDKSLDASSSALESCNLKGDRCDAFFVQRKWRKRCGGGEGDGGEGPETGSLVLARPDYAFTTGLQN